MKYFTDSKNLPFVIKIIKMRQLEGILTCDFELGYPIELSFKTGELIHIHQEDVSHNPDKLLDYMLKWVTFRINWRNEPLKIIQVNVSNNLQEAFQEALLGLIQEGSFLTPELTRLDPAFFGNPPNTALEPVKPEVAPVVVKTVRQESNQPANLISRPLPTNQNSKPRYTVETNLLLPPGPRQEQLEELLKTLNFPEQMAMLSRSHFTGCIYYRLGDNETSRTQYGLVLIIDGKTSDVIYHPSSQVATQNGNLALQALSGLNLTPEIYKVETRTLKAYRGLVSPEETTQVYGASNANFARILEAFKQSRRDGVVLLYFDSLKLHYFLMFENGLQVGIFGTDANSGRLQSLSAPVALPTNEKEATMTVQLVAKNTAIEAPVNTSSNKPVLNQPLTIPTTPQPTSTPPEDSDVIDWNGMLIDLNTRLEKPSEKSTEPPLKRRFEDDNPYDF